MLRIRIDANDRPSEPAFTVPKFGIKENLHPVADLELLCHTTLFAAVCPKDETDPSHDEKAAVDRPLRIASHKTPRKNVNPLEKKDAARKDKYYCEDIQKYFHIIACDDLSNYTH